MTTEQTQYRFTAEIETIGKPFNGGDGWDILVNWKLPGSRYNQHIGGQNWDDISEFKVGETHDWVLNRGGLKQSKDGRYATDYFWNWDMLGTSAPPSLRNKEPEPMGDPWAMEPKDADPRTERPNTGIVEQDKYQLSAARRDAMVLIEMGVWEIPEGRNPLSWVRECSARMFYFHHATPMEPKYWCYEHNCARNSGSTGYGHPVEGGSCIWEKGVVLEE